MTTKQCYESIELKKLLCEKLSVYEEAEIIFHIGTCAKCRSRLLELSASPTTIDNLKQFLPSDLSTDAICSTRHPSLKSLRRILAPTDDPAMIGRLGCHEISGVIGQGSSGIVFKALDTRLSRVVAIKLLTPSFRYDDSARLRFEREARAIATVAHENVVPIHSVDEFNGLPYFVMPYFPAGSLQQRINREGSLSIAEVVRLGMQVAKGLAEAHKQGIIHRDIKPANVLLETGIDRAYVSDFGLAQISDDALLTQTGVLAGTPEYMSPEQVQGKVLDCRTDLFSLGSVMYAACTGGSPFRSDTVFGVMNKVCDAGPSPIRKVNAEIPEWLEAFIAKLHSPKPDNRFESARDVANYLEDEIAYLNAPTVSNSPNRDWFLSHKPTFDTQFLFPAIGLMVVVAAVVMTWWQTVPNPRTSSQPTKQEQEIVPKHAPDQLLRRKIEIQREVKRLIYEGNSKLGHDDFLRAAECFRSALGLDSDNETARAGLSQANQKLEWCLHSYEKACAHAIQNESDDAFRWLEKAVRNGFHDVDCLEGDADLVNIRDDKRFERLINSLNTQIKNDDANR